MKPEIISGLKEEISNIEILISKLESDKSELQNIIYKYENPITVFTNRMQKLAQHQRVNHRMKQFVYGNIHTNSIEDFWGSCEKGLVWSTSLLQQKINKSLNIRSKF